MDQDDVAVHELEHHVLSFPEFVLPRHPTVGRKDPVGRAIPIEDFPVRQPSECQELLILGKCKGRREIDVAQARRSVPHDTLQLRTAVELANLASEFGELLPHDPQGLGLGARELGAGRLAEFTPLEVTLEARLKTEKILS